MGYCADITKISSGRSNTNSLDNIANFVMEMDVGGGGGIALQLLSQLESQQWLRDVRTYRLRSVGNWVLETSKSGRWLR